MKVCCDCLRVNPDNADTCIECGKDRLKWILTYSDEEVNEDAQPTTVKGTTDKPG